MKTQARLVGLPKFLKRERSRNSILLLLAILVSVALFSLAQFTASTPNFKLVGHPVPDFTISTWNTTPQQRVHLAALKGQPVVLNFWASWCDACREEAATFEAAWQKYQSRGVAFIGVAFQDNEADGIAFLHQYHVSYPSGPDTTGSISNVYGITNVGVPQTVFINRQGRVVSISVGAVDDTSLNRSIQVLLT